MVILPNLFGEWTLYREWGRMGQGGKVRMEWFDSEDEAKGPLTALETAKRRVIYCYLYVTGAAKGEAEPVF
jgi:predicted DNA-binding WGR domain protein